AYFDCPPNSDDFTPKTLQSQTIVTLIWSSAIAEGPPVRSELPYLIRPVWARSAAYELKKAGADVDSALQAADLQWQWLNNAEGWIHFARHAKLLEIAADKLEDDRFGLHLAQKVDPREAGVLAYIGIASDTLEAGLLNFARYSRVFTEAFQLDLSIKGGF